MHACMFTGVCAHRAGAQLGIYSNRAPIFPRANEGWGLIYSLEVSLVFTPGAYGPDWTIHSVK